MCPLRVLLIFLSATLAGRKQSTVSVQQCMCKVDIMSIAVYFPSTRSTKTATLSSEYVPSKISRKSSGLNTETRQKRRVVSGDISAYTLRTSCKDDSSTKVSAFFSQR
ncbi:hypothetical protein C4D60_Mb06t00970 [Musa balbisiana]|uniref:Secreted protein n=1 Tax=Musa balbisiana TaxID=52838 RepID=A0A4V4H3K9_MUSBA|nr:hypothetical protein C4D60_Mb06t00970 [Musa balbisiana]